MRIRSDANLEVLENHDYTRTANETYFKDILSTECGFYLQIIFNPIGDYGKVVINSSTMDIDDEDVRQDEWDTPLSVIDREIRLIKSLGLVITEVENVE